MIPHLNDIMYTLVEREQQVRDRLLDLHENGDLLLADSVNRSYGLLRYARAINLSEWVDAISMLRLGVVCGFIEPTEGSEQQLLTELSEQLLHGGDYADGEDIPEPPHPRAATEPQKARSLAIQSILNRTTLLTAPGKA
jgi:protein-arginine kinase